MLRPALASSLLLVAACDLTYPLDLTGLRRVELVDSNCGAPASSCANLGSRSVDFDGGLLETHSCVEGVDGGSPRWGYLLGDTVSSRALTAEQLGRVRRAVAALGLARARLENHDGPMSSVIVTNAKDRRELSPNEACGPEEYDRIVSGFPELVSTFDAL